MEEKKITKPRCCVNSSVVEKMKKKGETKRGRQKIWRKKGEIEEKKEQEERKKGLEQKDK